MKILLSILISCQIALADCTEAQKSLDLCNVYVKTLQAENDVLKQLNKKLKEQRDEATKKLDAETPPILPWWGWALIGAGAGAAAVAITHK